MTTTRAQFRAHIGRALGRRYYTTGTVTATSTTTQIVDSKRRETRREWDGAALLLGADRVTVRGSEPVTGRIFLDSALAGIPATTTAYELLKGFTFDDVDAAIDWAHAESYPQVYLPINDTATTETTGTYTYALGESWRSVSEVWREIESSSPVQYDQVFYGNDYVLRHGTSGLEYEALYTPLTGINLRFIGRGILSIGSTDASTSIAPVQLIVPGALHYLYSKGSNPDELSVGQKFDQRAQQEMALFERAKNTYRMHPQPKSARLPRIGVWNDGTSVTSDW